MKNTMLAEDYCPQNPGGALTGGYSNQGRKLLIVDDDPCILKITELFLKSNGYTCTTSENAGKAIDHLESDQFDLVLTDLHLPDMEGTALVKWIKCRLPATKVMMMTGDPTPQLKFHAIEHGEVKCLRKPFPLKKLLQEIEGGLTASSGVKPSGFGAQQEPATSRRAIAVAVPGVTAPTSSNTLSLAKSPAEMRKKDKKSQGRKVMTKILQIYKCQVCGNIVEMLIKGDGAIACCDQPMALHLVPLAESPDWRASCDRDTQLPEQSTFT